MPSADVAAGAGAVCLQFVRCGKPRCRCAGPSGVLHGPFPYLFWRTPDGRLRKRYLRAALLPTVLTAIAQRRRAHPPVHQTRAALAALRQMTTTPTNPAERSPEP